VYFGEERDSYAVVNSSTPEFDYPSGSDNVFAYYQGKAGVSISGLWHRLLFSYFFKDVNLLVTQTIVPRSRILIRRNLPARINYIAPFLSLDHDPYPVLYNGRLVWIVDAYTTSDHYPYSQRESIGAGFSIPDGTSYIRNSVKVVVDAYDGSTDFYVA